MKKYGLIGYPLSHSFSPGYFAKKFEKEGIKNCRYDLYPLDQIDHVTKLLDGSMKGFNVTIPYKLEIINYLHEISPEAKEIGAVNTVKIVDGHISGYNTDVYGFYESLKKLMEPNTHKYALILGTGGSSRAVKYALGLLGIKYEMVSSSGKGLAYDDLDMDIIKKHEIIINTTPLGMNPKIDTCPNIPYHFLTSNHILFDLVYNPEKTLFLKKGEAQGAKIKNGIEMLHLQAEKAWEIWNQ